MKLIGSPRRPEFDQFTIKFVIGAIALSLPLVELILTTGKIASISASFFPTEHYWPLWTRGLWSRNIFVGFLFAIATLLLAFNGRDELELWLGKIAAICAIGVAMFPCKCGSSCNEIIPYVHMGCAGVLYVVLGIFCFLFRKHAKDQGHIEGRRRMALYTLSCLGMVATVVIFIVHAFNKKEEFVFVGEWLGLLSFGVSWLTASHTVPYLANENEYNKLFSLS